MDGVFPIFGVTLETCRKKTPAKLLIEKPIDCQPRGLRESLIPHDPKVHTHPHLSTSSHKGGLAGNCSINAKSSDVLMIEVGDDGWTILVK